MTTTHEAHQSHSHHAASHSHGHAGQGANRIASTAHSLFNQNADWATFFREILGKDGIVAKAYPSPEALAAFKQTEEYAEIEKQFNQLRSKKGAAAAVTEPTKVITVRMPKCMHEYLIDEAEKNNTSMNSLCISRLLKVRDQPSEPDGHAASSKSASHDSHAKSNSQSHSHSPSHSHSTLSHSNSDKPNWSSH